MKEIDYEITKELGGVEEQVSLHHTLATNTYKGMLVIVMILTVENMLSTKGKWFEEKSPTIYQRLKCYEE